MKTNDENSRVQNAASEAGERSGGALGAAEFREKALEVLRREFPPPVPEVQGAELREEAPGYGEPSAGEISSEESAKGGTPSEAPSEGGPREREAAPPSEVIPARMMNEYVYCPRLFYYEFVEGIFRESADTMKGSAIHQRVDSGSGAMPKAQGKGGAAGGRKEAKGASAEAAPAPAESEAGSSSGQEESKPEIIHSRSVQMGSDRLGVVAKMDLVEVRLGASTVGKGEAEGAGASENGRPDGEAAATPDLFDRLDVCPVDYKAGSPKEGPEGKSEPEGPQLWDADKMQLGLQMLVLRDNGYRCDEGIIYYRGTRQRVRLPMTSELEEWIGAQVIEARRVAQGSMPGPLVNSPKCVRCSLAPICLPDETKMLSTAANELEATDENGDAARPAAAMEPRRLMAARDDCRALYLNTPGLRIGVKGETLQVKEKDKLLDEVRVRDVAHVALFGNIQISTQALQTLCEHETPITYFSMGGWFYGITRGHELKNVFLRKRQFQVADSREECLPIARQFVYGKIRNQRVLLRRNHVEPPEVPLRKLKVQAENALQAKSLEELLGIEGAAAGLYFQNFSGMIKVADEIDRETVTDAKGQMSFQFQNRNRRPPADPVNALLSLAYSMLAKDCLIAVMAVGFDPYIGFYHQPRFGRPALALDLMEEFRPLIAESTVLNCINNRVVTEEDFVRAGKAVNLSSGARKKFFQIYEQRITGLVIHPVFEYKVSYRRALELQARILAKSLTGEIPQYLPFSTR